MTYVILKQLHLVIKIIYEKDNFYVHSAACDILCIQSCKDRTITGKVMNEKDQPVANASVSVKGTREATVTANDGSFSITTTKEKPILVISSVGYETMEVKIKDQNSVNISLKFAEAGLEEVVVTGYGTQNKKDLTASAFSKMPTPYDSNNYLQGNVAGAQINGHYKNNHLVTYNNQ